MKFRVSMALMVALLLFGSIDALQAADSVLFFVNDPNDLSFVEMSKISSYCENYYRNLGILKSEDVDKFYQALANHGAQNIKGAKTYVGLVIQDATYGANSSGTPCGVLVVHGQFDKATVLDILKRHYQEHLTKTGHQAAFTEPTEQGAQVHRFGLPEKNRELTVMSVGKYTFFASGAVGDYRLLDETVKIVKEGKNKSKPEGEANVHYLLQFGNSDKERLSSLVDKKYQAYKTEKLRVNKRRGLKSFITGKIADHKVKFVKESLNELENVDINIYRMKNDSVNMKRLMLSANFENEEKARKVKRNILNHLNDAIKSAQSPEDKLGLSSNIKITSDGTRCMIETELGSEAEQIQCFALLSSYAARAILRN